MRWPQGIATPAGDARSRPASAVLGADHPLVAATETLESALRQWLVVGAVLLGSIAALVANRAWATALAVSAGAVLTALSMVLVMRRQVQRDCALAVILEYGECVPVAVVQRQRRRLLDPRTRTTLVRNLASVIDQASDRRRPLAWRSNPLFDRQVINAVADDLREIMRRLHGDATAVRGIALVERLLTNACSPLYGDRAEPLRDELRRIADVLSTARPNQSAEPQLTA